MKMIIFSKLFGPQEYDSKRNARMYALGTFAKITGDQIHSNKYGVLLSEDYWVVNTQDNRGQRVWRKCPETMISKEVRADCLLLGIQP